MEDVAGWLRDRGSELYNKSKRLDNEFGQRDAILKRAECWFDRASQVEAMGWRPIDEAPKDGTLIDLWEADAEERLPDRMWGRGAWRQFQSQEEEWVDVMYGTITHFMPLPAPPVKK